MTVSNAASSMSVASGPSVELKPFLYCLTELKYQYIRCLHLWYMSLTEEDMISLVSLLLQLYNWNSCSNTFSFIGTVHGKLCWYSNKSVGFDWY